MEETAAQGILSPVLSDVLTFLSIILSIILLIVVSYLWSIKKRDGEDLDKMESELKKLAGKIRELEDKISTATRPVKKVEEVPKITPFGIDPEQPRPSLVDKKPDGKAWSSFVENYNLIAASMSVPGQRKACEKFVADNGLRMLMYGGMMTFLPAVDVEESDYWAWKIPDNANQYAVVPNPMKPCDSALYSHGGLKETFATNFKNGTYKKYIINFPAMFICSETNNWILKQPGAADLERQ